MTNKQALKLSICAFLLLLHSSCKRKNTVTYKKQSNKKKQARTAMPVANMHSSEDTNINKKKQKSKQKGLDIIVENQSGKTLYIACFAYTPRRIKSRWRWFKSSIYEVLDQKKQSINLESISDTINEKNIFGTLGVFSAREDAENATYELLKDSEKLDLDLLYKLKNKRVVIEIEKYGFYQPFFEFDFVKLDEPAKKKEPIPSNKELDFIVVNNTGKPIIVCGFVYLKLAKGSWLKRLREKDDMAVWHFDKTKPILVQNKESAYIDVSSIASKRDRDYSLGYLGVFDQTEQKLASEATFELLDENKKLALGNLSDLKNKKIVIDVAQYGVKGNIIDYVTQPTQHVDWNKAIKE